MPELPAGWWMRKAGMSPAMAGEIRSAYWVHEGHEPRFWIYLNHGWHYMIYPELEENSIRFATRDAALEGAFRNWRARQ